MFGTLFYISERTEGPKRMVFFGNPTRLPRKENHQPQLPTIIKCHNWGQGSIYRCYVFEYVQCVSKFPTVTFSSNHSKIRAFHKLDFQMPPEKGVWGKCPNKFSGVWTSRDFWIFFELEPSPDAWELLLPGWKKNRVLWLCAPLSAKIIEGKPMLINSVPYNSKKGKHSGTT